MGRTLARLSPAVNDGNPGSRSEYPILAPNLRAPARPGRHACSAPTPHPDSEAAMFPRIRPLVLSLALLAVAGSAVAVPRTVLMEKFTNTS